MIYLVWIGDYKVSHIHLVPGGNRLHSGRQPASADVTRDTLHDYQKTLSRLRLWETVQTVFDLENKFQKYVIIEYYLLYSITECDWYEGYSLIFQDKSFVGLVLSSFERCSYVIAVHQIS